jgi:O-antigen ligase
MTEVRVGFRRTDLATAADAWAAAVAISLPWSTSTTSVLIFVWFLALLPTLDVPMLRQEFINPAGGIPVLLWMLGAIGMLWADVPWAERLAGLGSFHKLLVIPLLLAQFRRSGRGWWVILGLFASTLVVLLVSWCLELIPGLPWRGKVTSDGAVLTGLPVKDYIWQSELFALCAFALLGHALEFWRRHRWRVALALVLVAALLIVNIMYVELGRTTLVIIGVLTLLLAFHYFGFRAMVVACLIIGALGTVFWETSPYLRNRVAQVPQEVAAYQTTSQATSSGLRLEFLKRSIEIIERAPVFGHGTGTIGREFQLTAIGNTGPESWVTFNPHNQFLTIGIQLGLIGTSALLAMWCTHLALFRRIGIINWFGLVIVVQNFVGSLFNSHVFDFSQGWLYVFGVGVLGGMALRDRAQMSSISAASAHGATKAIVTYPGYTSANYP